MCSSSHRIRWLKYLSTAGDLDAKFDYSTENDRTLTMYSRTLMPVNLW